jgi:N-acetyl-anhydromuramyl-L-alanine amidase AmpD
MLDISKIVQLAFPVNQYYREEFAKKQIVIHHTASGRGIDGDFTHWLTTPGRIATAFIIGRDGTIYQLFSSKYWGHHLGIEAKFLLKKGFSDSKIRNGLLNKQSIAIEIDGWGALSYQNGKYYSYTGSEVPESEVTKYAVPFKHIASSEFNTRTGVAGKPAYFYQSYSPEQLQAMKDLVEFLAKKFNIPVTYIPDMWDVNLRALRGDEGVYTHVSYRDDKSDCHPQNELIETLKNLKIAA